MSKSQATSPDEMINDAILSTMQLAVWHFKRLNSNGRRDRMNHYLAWSMDCAQSASCDHRSFIRSCILYVWQCEQEIEVKK